MAIENPTYGYAAVVKKLRGELQARKGEHGLAASLGVDRSVLQHWRDGDADPSLLNAFFLAGRLGYRLALLPADDVPGDAP